MRTFFIICTSTLMAIAGEPTDYPDTTDDAAKKEKAQQHLVNARATLYKLEAPQRNMGSFILNALPSIREDDEESYSEEDQNTATVIKQRAKTLFSDLEQKTITLDIASKISAELVLLMGPFPQLHDEETHKLRAFLLHFNGLMENLFRTQLTMSFYNDRIPADRARKDNTLIKKEEAARATLKAFIFKYKKHVIDVL